MRKTLFAYLLVLVGLVPVLQVQAGGLIICHDIRILPHPVPPRPIRPAPTRSLPHWNCGRKRWM